MLKKLNIFALLLLLILAPATLQAGELVSGDIVIIYTNDVHTSVGLNQNEKTVTNLGYASVAGFVDYVASIVGANNVTLVDAGDAVQGDALGTLSKGSYLVDIMNAVGYDIFVPGNHEFDYGMTQMQTLMRHMNADVLSANFIDLRTNKPVYKPYMLVKYGDTMVAFVGITTPEAFSKSSPAYFQDTAGKFIYGLSEGGNGKDLYAAVQAAVDEASKQADYVVAVGHLGMDELSAPWRSVDVIANTRGIDAFIDGHSHSTVASQLVPNADGKGVLLTQTGTKLSKIGMLVIPADGAPYSELVRYSQPNTKVKAFVENITTKFEADLSKVVARSSVDLVTNHPVREDTRIIRSHETNLGDFVADAYRIVLGNGAGSAADVAIVNGGGIRANIASGDITFGEVIAVHPFNNMGMVVEATGQEILDALEMSARAVPEENGGFLQVSGLTFVIDTSVQSSVVTDDHGSFVSVSGARRVSNVMVAGKAIDPQATYTVAGHNYMMLDGGDGINMFRDNKVVVQPVLLDNQLLINYVRNNLRGVIGKDYAKPYGQGRIVIK
jgi:2',3'-cyclic-nucleotide 2'-phosphodiesterase (5'-nucleotidase family)